MGSTRSAGTTARTRVRGGRWAAILSVLGLLVTVCSPLIVIRAFIYAPLVLQMAVFLPYLVGLLLVFMLLGLVYYYHTQSRYWYYGLEFALFYSWAFSLQTY